MPWMRVSKMQLKNFLKHFVSFEFKKFQSQNRKAMAKDGKVKAAVTYVTTFITAARRLDCPALGQNVSRGPIL
jgi:hypothetical protein